MFQNKRYCPIRCLAASARCTAHHTAVRKGQQPHRLQPTGRAIPLCKTIYRLSCVYRCYLLHVRTSVHDHRKRTLGADSTRALRSVAQLETTTRTAWSSCHRVRTSGYCFLGTVLVPSRRFPIGTRVQASTCQTRGRIRSLAPQTIERTPAWGDGFLSVQRRLGEAVCVQSPV